MTYDICVKVKDLGDVYGSYLKSTMNSVYLGNALINKANGVTVSLFKIEKKYIISISRMAIPSFDIFNDAQLAQIINLNVPAYTIAAQKVIASRQALKAESLDLSKHSENGKKSTKDKKEQKAWNQFNANKEMFGIEPKFSMEEYAEAIDRNAPGYKELKAMSQRIAKDILSQNVSDLHRQEERLQSTVSNGGDDQMYSTVQSSSKWDSAYEKKKLEKTGNETSKVSLELSNLSLESRKDTTSEIKKDSQIESKKAANDTELELAKEHENFKNGGWSSVVQFLSEKAKKENAIQAETKPSVDSIPTSPCSVSRDKSPKPQSESLSKSTSNITTDLSKQIKSKEKRINSGTKKGTDKLVSSESRVVKPSSIISPIKFSSADLCIKHVIQNFKNYSHDKNKTTWGSNSNLFMSELFLHHLDSLTEAIFSSEKLDEIKHNISSQTKSSVSLHKN